MKKLKAFIFTLMLFFASSSYVYAVCDATELNTLRSVAANVRASYEEMRELLDPSEYTPPDGTTEDGYEAYYTFFRIYVTNLTEDIYIEVHNDANGETNTYTYEDSDNGTITFDWADIYLMVNYTIKVYSSDNTNCSGTELYTLYLTTPRFNQYSTYDMCDGAEDFYLCYEYLSIPDDVSFGKFVELIERYKNGLIDDDGNEVEDSEKEENGFIQFLGDHYIAIIIIAVVIIAAGVTVTVIIVKKQRSRIV